MVGRVVAVVLTGPLCVLSTIGALAVPGRVIVGWVLLGAAVGLVVAVGAPRLPRGRSGPAPLVGVATAAAFVTACLMVAGLLATAGGGLAATVLVLLVAGGLWAGYHRRTVAPTASEPPDVAPPRPAPPQPAAPAPVTDMATEDLCVAWRRSYFLLILAADEQARRLVVQRRQDFLDEIERRDRRGFLCWLRSGAQAGSDPGPYLTPRN